MGGIPCDACNRAKAQRLPFSQASKVHAPLDRLHLDLMGLFYCRGIRGEWYVLCLVDHYSGFAAVVPIRRNNEAPLVVQTIIIQWLTILTGCQFKILRSDRAKEFLVGWFEEWLVQMGAVHELSESYTAEQNGAVERYNGIVSGIARSIHIESRFP
jgi:transposase InsO family protein